MKTTLTIAALLLSILSTACQSTTPSAHIERMYSELREEIGNQHLSTHNDQFWIHQQQRLKDTRKLVSENRITTAVDHLYAAVILVETDSEADLDSAHTQALLAAEQGETRGFRVAAEATDKLCVKRGLLQRFGTQYVYEPVLKAWRLYPFDPNTTDAERKAMGVESMVELREREKLLNEIMGGKPN